MSRARHTPDQDRQPCLTALPERSTQFALHHYGSRWHLCDRSYLSGKQLHTVRESYGREKPKLFPPAVRSGITEQVLPTLPPGSFDLVYLDPPYGLTEGDWDHAPDWSWLGSQTARLLKPTGQVVLHGQGAMAARAVAAFEESLAYRFEIVWVKASAPDSLLHTGILQGALPLHSHELIHVFRRQDSKAEGLTYNPAAMHRRGKGRGRYLREKERQAAHWGRTLGPYEGIDTGWRYPADVVFSLPNKTGQLYAAKPIDLVRYLILLLTRPGDLILEPYAGSGTTLLAAYRLGRRSLGIEASPKSWAILQANLGGLLSLGDPEGDAPTSGRADYRRGMGSWWAAPRRATATSPFGLSIT